MRHFCTSSASTVLRLFAENKVMSKRCNVLTKICMRHAWIGSRSVSLVIIRYRYYCWFMSCAHRSNWLVWCLKRTASWIPQLQLLTSNHSLPIQKKYIWAALVVCWAQASDWPSFVFIPHNNDFFPLVCFSRISTSTGRWISRAGHGSKVQSYKLRLELDTGRQTGAKKKNGTTVFCCWNGDCSLIPLVFRFCSNLVLFNKGTTFLD